MTKEAMTPVTKEAEVTEEHRAAAHALAVTCSYEMRGRHNQNCEAIARAFAERDRVAEKRADDRAVRIAEAFMCAPPCGHGDCKTMARIARAIRQRRP